MRGRLEDVEPVRVPQPGEQIVRVSGQIRKAPRISCRAVAGQNGGHCVLRRVGNSRGVPVPGGLAGQRGETGKTLRVDSALTVQERVHGKLVEDDHDDGRVRHAICQRGSVRLGGSSNPLDRCPGQKKNRHHQQRGREKGQELAQGPVAKIGATTKPRQNHPKSNQEQWRHLRDAFQNQQRQRKHKQCGA